MALLVGCTGDDHGSPSTPNPTTPGAMAAKCRHLVSTWKPVRNGAVSRPISGSHLRMGVGEERSFQIVIYPDTYTGWTTPHSSNPRVAELADVRDPLRNGVSYNCLVSGTIVARAPGTATVGSSADSPCFHIKGYSCGMPTFPWLVTVTVVSR